MLKKRIIEDKGEVILNKLVKGINVTTVLLMVLQFLVPLTALADVGENVTETPIIQNDIQLESFQGPSEFYSIDDKLPFALQMVVSSNGQLEKTVSVSGNITLEEGSNSLIGDKGENLGNYYVSNNQISLSVNQEAVTSRITVNVVGKIKDGTLDSEVMAQVDGQTSSAFVKNKIPIEETVTSTEAINSNTSTSETSATETTDSTSEGTTETTSPAKVVAKKQVKAVGQEMSHLFPAEGQNSLITAFQVTDLSGNPLTEVELGDDIKVSFKYNIPDSVREKLKAGDYFEYQLPSQIFPSTKQTEPLVGDNGEVYGVVTIGTDGKMRIEFNEHVEQESQIKGSIYYEGEVSQGDWTTPGENEIGNPFDETQPGIPVIVKPTTNKEVEKKGHVDRPFNPNEITWTVDINKGMNALTNAKVTESFPQGVNFESVTVYSVEVDFKGNVIDGSEKVVNPSEYTVGPDGSVTFKGTIKGAYRLEYVTSVDPNSKPANGVGGEVTFKNTVNLSANELPKPIPAESTIVGKYKPALEKEKPSYDPSKQQFTWTVHYNHDENVIPLASGKLDDRFEGNMTFVDGSVVVKQMAIDGKGTATEVGRLVENVDYKIKPDADDKGIHIEFLRKIDYAVTIEYKTQIQDEVIGSVPYKNTIVDGSGHTSNNQGTSTQQGLIKNIDHVDQKAKMISWKSDVNKNGYLMKNWNLTDTLSPGLTLERLIDFSIKDVTTGAILDQMVDYTISYENQSKTEPSTIKVAFIGNYAETSDTFEIFYKTRFDTATLNEAGLSEFYNKAASNWKSSDGMDMNISVEKPYKPSAEESADGFKSGSYNAVDKVITWSMGINYNRQELGEVTLTDPITSNQKFIPGSVRVYKYTIDADGSYHKGEEITGDARFTITEPTTSLNTLTINISEVGTVDQFMFEFQTSLVGEVVNDEQAYKNKATVVAEKVQDSFSIEGTVSIANGGSLIEKSGKQDADGFVNWTVEINKSQSTIYNAVITDKPSTNQILDISSVLLYETAVAADGKITKGALLNSSKYTKELTTNNETGEQQLVVTFLDKKIDRPYILEYKAMAIIESGTTGKVTNEVTLSGNNEGELSETEQGSTDVKVSQGGGTAEGTKGQLTIKKTDESGAVLTGAEFELWDKNGHQVLRSGPVLSDGTLLFGQLPYGQYILKETKAPAGHTIASDLVAGRLVEINKDTSTTGSYLTIVNEESTVHFQKTDEQGSGLHGAEFSLEKEVLGIWQLVNTGSKIVSNATGKVTIRGLEEGHYRVKEIKAPTQPKEYLLNPNYLEFDVVVDSSGSIPVVDAGSIVNYLGAAKLVKTSEKGVLLAGAVFELRRIKNANGGNVSEIIGANFVTDAQGEVAFNDLAPGTYEVKEIKAPSGYLLNTKPVTFMIDKFASSKPSVTPVSFVDYQGSMSFIKMDEEGNFLKGAEFDVKDATGKIVQQATTDIDGKIFVEGLAPGKYTIEETKAPESFILNTQAVNFEIVSESAGKPTTVALADFINYQGSVKIRKVDSLMNGLGGAEFTLYKGDGTKVGVYTSDMNTGLIEIKKLAPGDYKLVETKAPSQEQVGGKDDFILNAYPVNFTIEESFAGKYLIKNLGNFQNFKGTVSVTKTDKNGKPLAGAEFDLFKLNDATGEEVLTQHIVADENGKINYTKFGSGYYKLVETKAPAGHIINANPIYITVEDDATQNPIEDSFKFANYQGSVAFKKVDNQQQELTEAVFDLYKEDGTLEQENIVYNHDKGQYFADELAPGRYYFQEIKAPDGFIINSDKIEFEIKDNQMNEPETVILEDFVNYKGAVELVKEDSSGDPLEDATFTLYKDGQEIRDAISDPEGKVEFTELAPGNYTIKETKAPLGYLINPKEISFEIKSEIPGEIKTINLSEEDGAFINYQGAVSFKKINEQGIGLEGAVFTLLDANNKVVKENVTSDIDGSVSVDGLVPGDYKFIETSAVPGYILNSETIPFTIPEALRQADEELIITPDVAEFVNYQGTYGLTKTDENGVGLVGAEFTATNQETKEEHLSTSDESGTVNWTDLSPGDYVVKETKAPTGYILNEKEVTFVIAKEAEGKPEGQVLAGDFVNYQGKVTLRKVDAGDKKKVLSGAIFDLMNASGEVIQSDLVTDKNGEISVDQLEPGEYAFVETKAPTGYEKDETKQIFEIVSQGKEEPKEISVIVTNKKEEVKGTPNVDKNKKPTNGKFPQTGELNSSWMFSLGITILGMSYIIYRKRKTEDHF